MEKTFKLNNPIYYLQCLYSIVLNFLFKFVGKIPEKVRDIILWLSMLLLWVICFFRESLVFTKLHLKFNLTEWMLIGTAVLLLIILFSIKQPLIKMQINKLFCFFYFLLPILIIFASFFHELGRGMRPFALILLFIFPALYYVWGCRGDYEKIFRMLACSIVIVGTVLILLNNAYLVYSKQDLTISEVFVWRYAGLFRNPNALGVTLIPIFTGLFYLFYTEKRKSFLWLVTILILASFLLLFTGSRTALLAVVAQFFVFIIFIINKNKGQNAKGSSKKSTTRAVVIILVVLIMFATLFTLVSLSRSPEHPQIKMVFLEHLVPDFNRSLTDLSSGRLDIWKSYISELTLLGKNPAENPIYLGDAQMSAHNTSIEIAFRAGIPAGICFTILLLIALFFAFRCMGRSRSIEKYMVFPALAISAYFFPAMLEVPFMAFSAYSNYVLCFYIAISVLMFKSNAPQIEIGEKQDAETIDS